ncbi:HNH endonuclease [Lachnospiraceae bacterium 45-W7]
MKGNMKEVKEVSPTRFADSALGKKANDVWEHIKVFADKSVAGLEDHVRNCPLENGEWSGERGNSKWKPDKQYIPQKMNPEAKNWDRILKQYGIDGINFRDGEPDFRPISKGDVKIKEFSSDRTDNFDRADMELARRHGCSPEKVKEWRKNNKYTWHECKDQKTMQKVPSIVHNNVSHRGGISEAKKGA